jgi:hypothetical protein
MDAKKMGEVIKTPHNVQDALVFKPSIIVSRDHRFAGNFHLAEEFSSAWKGISLPQLPLLSQRRRIPVIERHPVERADRIDDRIPSLRLVGCVTRKHVFIFFPGVISRGELGIDGW